MNIWGYRIKLFNPFYMRNIRVEYNFSTRTFSVKKVRVRLFSTRGSGKAMHYFPSKDMGIIIEGLTLSDLRSLCDSASYWLSANKKRLNYPKE